MTSAPSEDRQPLDQEIRQLPVLLLRAREAFSAQFRPIFLTHDLTDPQWRVLRILANSPDVDTAHLAKRSNLLGPSLSRIVRDLSQRGLIARTLDPVDARRSFHALTPAGQQVIATVSPDFTPIYDALKTKLGERRIVQISEALADLLEVLDHAPTAEEPDAAPTKAKRRTPTT